jgi:hypothetical protein
MMTLTAVVIVLGLPVAGLLAVLAAVDALQRRRDARIARQIEVTDAIHAEFGAIVAPLVRHARGGWRVTLPMDPRHPHAARVVELVALALGPTVSVDVAVAAGRSTPPPRTPRRPAAQNRERIASAMST